MFLVVGPSADGQGANMIGIFGHSRKGMKSSLTILCYTMVFKTKLIFHIFTMNMLMWHVKDDFMSH